MYQEMIKLCDLQQPKEVYKAVEDVLKSGVYVKGPLVEEFEEKWAERCGMKYAIGVSSGAIALEIAIQSRFDKKHPFISYSSYTYKAVHNAIVRMGFYAISGVDDGVDIYAHHLHDMRPTYGPALEDCSHCHGYKPVADTAIFSLYPTKILGACGDAGIIVTNNENLTNYAKDLRNHGYPNGTNGRMDEVQAAVLLAKLPYLDKWIEKRLEIVKKYDKGLDRSTPGTYHYAYCIEGSEEKADKLRSMGVETTFYYSTKYMALPLHPYLTDEEVRKVIECVHLL